MSDGINIQFPSSFLHTKQVNPNYTEISRLLSRVGTHKVAKTDFITHHLFSFDYVFKVSHCAYPTSTEFEYWMLER